MRRVSVAFVGALMVAGTAFAVSTPANAQVEIQGYFGTDPYYGADRGYGADPYYDQGYGDQGYDPHYGQYAYDDYYDPSYNPSCDDYYAPPWGYPPDYCNYEIWYDPIYFGGAWYSGPIYYNVFGGENLYWLNGGWRRDEWRGARAALHRLGSWQPPLVGPDPFWPQLHLWHLARRQLRQRRTRVESQQSQFRPWLRPQQWRSSVW